MDALAEYFAKLEECEAGFEDKGPITPHSRSRVGDTPLHWAAISDEAEIVQLLLDAGAEINTPGESDYTPLDYAILHKSSNTIEILRQNGGSTNFHEQAD